MTLEQLRALLAQQVKDFEAYAAGIKNADGTARGMTEDEVKAFNALIAKAKDTKASIEALEVSMRTAAEMRGITGTTAPTQAEQQTRGALAATPGVEIPLQDKKQFKSMADFVGAVAKAGMQGDLTGMTDSRLVYGKAAGANETVPSEGGFLVQEDFAQNLLDLVHDGGDIMSRVTNIPISANSNALRMPMIDETSRARGSRWGGVRAYWLAEGEQKIDSKPKFGALSLALNKIAGLAYATDELLQDSTAMTAIINKAIPEEIRFECEDAIINGDGVGKPLGILKSGACAIVAKEGGQAAGTVTFGNLTAMIDALPVRSLRNAVWLTNDSGLSTQFYGITLPGGAGHPIFLPAGQNAATPGNSVIGTLMGRPVIPVEYLPVTGAGGDLILADLSEYITIDKGGIQANESMHVRFIYDEMTFRFVYRMDGKPSIRQGVTTANGGKTKSPFVALGART